MPRLLPLVFLAAPGSAWALSLGSTWGFGSGFGFDPFDFDGVVRFGFAPTLDIRADPVIGQIHALELVDAAVDGEVYLGGNLYFEMHRAEVGGPWSGVVQPGLSLDLCCDPIALAFGPEVRLGIEAASAAGFGVYVVPAIGVATGGDAADLYTGGTLQVSTWFGLGGGP